MTMPILMEEITLSEIIHQAQVKIAEHLLLADVLELNERDMQNIIERSIVQRKLITLRSTELKLIVDRLQAFADNNPIIH